MTALVAVALFGQVAAAQVTAVETYAVRGGISSDESCWIGIDDGRGWASGLCAGFTSGGVWWSYRKSACQRVDLPGSYARVLRLEVSPGPAGTPWTVAVDGTVVASGHDPQVRTYKHVSLAAHGAYAGHDVTQVETSAGTQVFSWSGWGDLTDWDLLGGTPLLNGGHLWGGGYVQIGKTY